MTKLRRQRGIALITVLLATVLLMVVLAVMIDVGTAQLRRTADDLRAAQALGAADAGAGWVRGLIAAERGDINRVAGDLAAANNARSIRLDAHTTLATRVILQLDTPGTRNDHTDFNVQQDASIVERPIQVICDGAVLVDGTQVARRIEIVLLRAFRGNAPYSEIVGVIDAASLNGAYSPGDSAGQQGDANHTDLRIRAVTQMPDGSVQDQSVYRDDHWSDGNPSVQSGG